MRPKELHLGSLFVEGGYLEGADFHIVYHTFDMDKKFLTVPDIIAVAVGVFRMLQTGGVSASDEMSDTAICTGRCVPQNLSGATIVHWGRPNGKDGVFLIQSAIVKQGLVLSHSGAKRDIIVLAPATQRVKKEDRVFVP